MAGGALCGQPILRSGSRKLSEPEMLVLRMDMQCNYRTGEKPSRSSFGRIMRLVLLNLCRAVYLSRVFIKSHFKRRAFVELNWHLENFSSLYLIRRD